MTALFFIDNEGHLQLFSASLSVTYPVSSITRRYEEMVSTFGKRPLRQIFLKGNLRALIHPCEVKNPARMAAGVVEWMSPLAHSQKLSVGRREKISSVKTSVARIEMLKKIQETSFSDLLEANFDTSFSTLKAGVSNMVLDATGKPHGLSGSTGNCWTSMECHRCEPEFLQTWLT
ncbi:hypothetical protein ACFX4S_02770 [Kosakonia sp. YIM B13605]|jgi:hypothetical protein|uniref:hypothetical protein n=1 Tax=Kosakonia TaxID=1330547 RepID=UPI0028AEC7DF|nr:hypothetical protein [Kosakonia sacchari]